MEPRACQPGSNSKKRFFIKIQSEVSEVADEYSKQGLSRFSLKVPEIHMKYDMSTSSVYSSSTDQNIISFQITKFLASNSSRNSSLVKEESDNKMSQINQNDSQSLTLPVKNPLVKKSKTQMCSPVCMII